MSNYSRFTRHPETGKWERAFWADDYFGHYEYGVIFPSDGSVFDPRKTTIVIEINQEEANILNAAMDAKRQS